jgi:hypothetical protein
MRRILRLIDTPRDNRIAMLGDALGVLALFAMAYAALHLPVLA